MPQRAKALVERLFAEHRTALEAFFHRRIRTKSEAPDLAQEVYLRMLRVSDADAIRNPELYLYTVANNLVKENAVLDRRQASGVEIEGQPAATYKAGDVLFVPAGAIHRAKNVGSGNGAELATYIVEKGMPLVVTVTK